jgi:protein TonB
MSAAAASRTGEAALKLASAIAINILLFALVPGIQELLGLLHKDGRPLEARRRVMAEIGRPEKKKEEQPLRQRIREVKSVSARMSAGGMKLRFTPDLTVEGGQGVAVATRQDMEAVIFEEGETDEDFVRVFTPPPPYPDRARELGIEGELEVEFVVDIDGRVSSVQVLRSPHPTIASEARRVVSGWRFKPAKNKGVPVRVRARQVFDFKLE